MTLRHGYVTTWDRLLLIGVGHKKTAEIIKIKISMSQLGAAGSNGLKYLNSLTYKSNLDVNLIDCKLLKIAANVITDFIHYLLNLSLSVGCFPSEWKIAKVTPIFKGKGSKTSEMNYRPISVLSHVAKIMEKAIQIQLSNYIAEKQFISTDQSAFLKHHSTQTALHKVVDDCLDTMNNGMLTVCSISRNVSTH